MKLIRKHPVLSLGFALLLLLGGVVAAEQLWLWWGTRHPADEARRLADLAGLRPTDTVAEIGAGAGEMARVVAARVPKGRLIVTELSEDRLADLRTLASHGLTNVEVRTGDPNGTNLPDRCCALIYMRHVYHHFVDPPRMTRALAQALQPGGRLAVIDFTPQRLLNFIAPLEGPDRGGHGIALSSLVDEVTAAGFTVERQEPRWTSSSYLALFRARVDGQGR